MFLHRSRGLTQLGDLLQVAVSISITTPAHNTTVMIRDERFAALNRTGRYDCITPPYIAIYIHITTGVYNSAHGL